MRCFSTVELWNDWLNFERVNDCENQKTTLETQKITVLNQNTFVETNEYEFKEMHCGELLRAVHSMSFTLPQFNQSFHSGTVEKHLISAID